MKYFLAWIFLPSIALAATSGFSVGFQTADSVAPTTPTALTANAVSNSQIDLSWTASTDAFGVSGYRVFRDNVFLATSTLTTYSDTGLSASTSYSYVVSAFDPSFNESVRSATATATTTDIVVSVATTTATTSSSGGGRSDMRQGVMGTSPFLPTAISNLIAESGVGKVVLQWKNPIAEQFVGVRIIRSEKGFPQDAYDGAMVFSGRGNVFIDGGVVADKEYYYGVFATYSGGILASPAVVSGVALSDEAVVEGEAIGLLPPKPLFKLKEFSFKQGGVVLEIVDGLIKVNPELPLEVFVSASVLPKEARVVMLELVSLDEKVGSWVLVYDRDTANYQAVLPNLGGGDFLVSGSVYDNSFILIGVGGNAKLQSEGGEVVSETFVEGAIANLWGYWWLWVLILLLLGLLYRVFKAHGYEKGM